MFRRQARKTPQLASSLHPPPARCALHKRWAWATDDSTQGAVALRNEKTQKIHSMYIWGNMLLAFSEVQNQWYLGRPTMAVFALGYVVVLAQGINNDGVETAACGALVLRRSFCHPIVRGKGSNWQVSVSTRMSAGSCRVFRVLQVCFWHSRY